MDLAGKKVLVVGLGKSGVAAARFCVSAGARVTATDCKPAGELGPAVAALAPLPVSLALGGHDPALFQTAEGIIVSPGVPSDLPGLAEARGRGVPVIGEMELALGRLRTPLVAVTGTNGKTTTTALLGHLLRECGVRACVAGNIGTALLDALPEAQGAEWVVLEVSSFQIETTPSLSPRIAVLLNVTPDHLDRHGSFDAYVECKARLLRQVAPAGFCIFNAADERAAAAAVGAGRRLIPFDATGKILARGEGRPRAWFGAGDLWVSLHGEGQNRYPLGPVRLEGIHNRENMLGALSAAELCGAEPHQLAVALAAFRGLPHRVELVGEHRGVRYYDDSKGTNVGAAIRAIEAFAEPIVLIAGGLSKGVDFAPLALRLAGRVKRAILIGEAAPAMARAFSGRTETVRAASMEEAVALAVQAADPGEVVLLSPACASFDMFRDYADRGEQFAAAVGKIMNEK